MSAFESDVQPKSKMSTEEEDKGEKLPPAAPLPEGEALVVPAPAEDPVQSSLESVPLSVFLPTPPPATSNLKKFRLLLWKNYVLQKRHKVQTVFEICLPLFFISILLIIRNIVTADKFPGGMEFSSWSPNNTTSTVITKNLAKNFISPSPSFILHVSYAPNTSLANDIMTKLQTNFLTFVSPGGLSTVYQLRPFTSEQQLVDAYLKSPGGILGAVIFEEVNGDKIRYKLRMPGAHETIAPPVGSAILFISRWYTNFVYPRFQLVGPRQYEDFQGGIPGYYSQGFTYLQFALDASIIQAADPTIVIAGSQLVHSFDVVNVKLQRFPYPPFVDDLYLFALQQQLPLMIVLSFIYPFVNLTKSLVIEKERKLKESMKMMGLPNYLHWSAWFLKHFLFLLITLFIMVSMLKVTLKDGMSIIPATHVSVIVAFLLVYSFTSTMLAFFVSTLFSKANSASTGAGVIWFILYFPFFFLAPRYDTLSQTTKIISSLLCNTAMSFGCQIMLKFEGTSDGSQWNNIGTTLSHDDHFSLLLCLQMLLLDGIIYFLLAMYIEGVMPGEFGVPLPWYFPFSKIYWCGYDKYPSIHNAPDKSKNVMQRNENYQAEPVNVKAGVQIQDLTKTFGTKKAVRGLNLNMYENQVTVLLGHNGAGKSTTMSMLTGLFPPTSGTAIINGYDIRTNIKEVRGSLGLCPQHDVLFDELTCEEHLKFFCWMKGCDNVKEETDHILTALNFEPKRHAQAGTLSGGMKRKLSVGIALCGGSKVVLLDEPTSGMDPGARRSTWDLITSEKQNRTLLLSTHFMDEADLLGDRIAIMAAGQLQTVGSSLFLKNRFGAGYHLVVVKKPGCDARKISDVIRKHLGEAHIEQYVGAELSYALSHSKSHLFADMFVEMEQRREELLIDSYGAGITTMEEVFMRVGKEVEDKNPNHANQLTVSEASLSVSLHASGGNNIYEDHHYNSGFALHQQQFRAMLVKKALYLIRNKILFLVQLLIPAGFLTLILTVIKTLPKDQDNPNLPINLNPFRDSVTVLSCNRVTNPLCNIYEIYGIQSQTQIRKTTPGETLSSIILSESDKSLPTVNTKYIIGMERSGNNVTAFFNNQPFHAQPIALNFVMNALFRHLTSNSNKQIIASNHPLPYTPLDDVNNAEGIKTTGFQVGFNVVFGMSFLASSFVVFLIKERATKAKHLQFVSGVRFWIFWLANFTFDYVLYLVTCIFLLIIIVVFRAETLNTIEALSYVFLLFVVYGLAMIPLMYVFSFGFDVPSTGFTRMIMFNLFSGLATILAVTILEIPTLELKKQAEILDWIFMIFSNYDLGHGIGQISKNVLMHDNCKIVDKTLNLTSLCIQQPDNACCTEYPYGFLDWHPPGIGRYLLFLVIIGFISIIILIAVEGKHLENITFFGFFKNNQVQQVQTMKTDLKEDSDVAAEAKRIRTTNLEDLFKSENLIIKDLSKQYDSFVAVQCLNVGVEKKECFGLLGVNGAGKTSTFKMLTGDLRPSSGDAFICGHSINSEIKEVQQHLGYCPQFDAIIEQFTGRETIRLFARLRGIREDEIDGLANRLGDGLIFREHMEKLVSAYSGGNKRKLSTAVALVGNPPLVFLDEPSTGMDPVARRHLWNCISKVRDAGASIILTSHSMEECEALCTRLVVMVNGQFRCLGSTQHLKSKFGEGYTVIAQTSTKSRNDRKSLQEIQRRKSIGAPSPLVPWEKEIEPLKQFIESSFPGSILKDVHPGYVHYHVNNSELSWGALFRKMEEAKERFKLEAYSVGQTSLEQVFLNFAKAQVAVE